MYVIVNMTRGPMLSDDFYVLPGEEPHTFNTLQKALDAAEEIADEYDHTIGDTIKIYQLTEVDYGEI